MLKVAQLSDQFPDSDSDELGFIPAPATWAGTTATTTE